MPNRIGILIFAKKGRSRGRLVQAAQAHNLRVYKPQFSQLTFDAGREADITWRGRDLASWGDICIIRGTDQHQVEAKVLADYLHAKGLVVLDKVLTSRRFLASKLADDFLLTEAGIHHPETYQALDQKGVYHLLHKLEYPILVKDIHGAHSEGIYALKSMARANQFFRWHDPASFVIQKYLPTDSYIRVMIVGDEIVGSMQRTKLRAFTDRKHVQEAKSKPYQLSKEEERLALKAHRAVDNDISGVDILKVHGELYVLEVNRAPQFGSMERVCHLDIADKIISYVLTLFKNKSK
ncbi:MAG: ATP-grasp domain-containing protein [bacterium]|nr:ATP-grasp domain-containing protein [bacterium]